MRVRTFLGSFPLKPVGPSRPRPGHVGAAHLLWRLRGPQPIRVLAGPPGDSERPPTGEAVPCPNVFSVMVHTGNFKTQHTLLGQVD